MNAERFLVSKQVWVIPLSCAAMHIRTTDGNGAATTANVFPVVRTGQETRVVDGPAVIATKTEEVPRLAVLELYSLKHGVSHVHFARTLKV